MYEHATTKNVKYSKALSWKARDFFGGECPEISTDFIDKVREFQHSLGMTADGIVGPMTLTRLETAEEFERMDKNSVLVDGVAYDIDNPASLNQDGLRYGYGVRRGTPQAIILHWDATFSASHGKRILSKRNLSTHFFVDNNGDIIQLFDPVKIRCYHAGPWNDESIGIDITNAVYPKYQKWYEKNGHGSRPEIEATIHGQRHELLGYYPEQIEATKKLVNLLCETIGIEKQVPDTNGLHQPLVDHKWSGVAAHYHLTERKWDVAGFPFQELFN